MQSSLHTHVDCYDLQWQRCWFERFQLFKCIHWYWILTELAKCLSVANQNKCVVLSAVILTLPSLPLVCIVTDWTCCGGRFHESALVHICVVIEQVRESSVRSCKQFNLRSSSQWHNNWRLLSKSLHLELYRFRNCRPRGPLRVLCRHDRSKTWYLCLIYTLVISQHFIWAMRETSPIAGLAVLWTSD